MIITQLNCIVLRLVTKPSMLAELVDVVDLGYILSAHKYTRPHKQKEIRHPEKLSKIPLFAHLVPS